MMLGERSGGLRALVLAERSSGLCAERRWSCVREAQSRVASAVCQFYDRVLPLAAGEWRVAIRRHERCSEATLVAPRRQAQASCPADSGAFFVGLLPPRKHRDGPARIFVRRDGSLAHTFGARGLTQLADRRCLDVR
jgi:hypothetical protein